MMTQQPNPKPPEPPIIGISKGIINLSILIICFFSLLFSLIYLIFMDNPAKSESLTLFAVGVFYIFSIRRK